MLSLEGFVNISLLCIRSFDREDDKLQYMCIFMTIRVHNIKMDRDILPSDCSVDHISLNNLKTHFHEREEKLRVTKDKNSSMQQYWHLWNILTCRLFVINTSWGEIYDKANSKIDVVLARDCRFLIKLNIVKFTVTRRNISYPVASRFNARFSAQSRSSWWRSSSKTFTSFRMLESEVFRLVKNKDEIPHQITVLFITRGNIVSFSCTPKMDKPRNNVVPQ